MENVHHVAVVARRGWIPSCLPESMAPWCELAAGEQSDRNIIDIVNIVGKPSIVTITTTIVNTVNITSMGSISGISGTTGVIGGH